MKVKVLFQVGRGEQGEGAVGREAEGGEEAEGAGGRDGSSGFLIFFSDMIFLIFCLWKL